MQKDHAQALGKFVSQWYQTLPEDWEVFALLSDWPQWSETHVRKLFIRQQRGDRWWWLFEGVYVVRVPPRYVAVGYPGLSPPCRAVVGDANALRELQAEPAQTGRVPIGLAAGLQAIALGLRR
jgi:hypothetical protein